MLPEKKSLRFLQKDEWRLKILIKLILQTLISLIDNLHIPISKFIYQHIDNHPPKFSMSSQTCQQLDGCFFDKRYIWSQQLFYTSYQLSVVMFDVVLKIKTNQIWYCDRRFLFALVFDYLLSWLEKYFQGFLLVEDVFIVDVHQCTDWVQSKMVVLVETPFCELSELFQRSMRVFQYLWGHESNFVLFGTSPSYDIVPLVLLDLTTILILLFSHGIELLNFAVFKIDFILSLFFTVLLWIVVVFHYKYILSRI